MTLEMLVRRAEKEPPPVLDHSIHPSVRWILYPSLRLLRQGSARTANFRINFCAFGEFGH